MRIQTHLFIFLILRLHNIYLPIETIDNVDIKNNINYTKDVGLLAQNNIEFYCI